MPTYHTLRKRDVDPIPVLWNTYSQVSAVNEEMHGCKITNSWLTFRGGQFQNFYLAEEWNEVSNYLSQRLLTDDGYLPHLYNLQKAAAEKIEAYITGVRHQDLKGKSNDELLALYGEAQECWIQYDQPNVYPWFVGGDMFQQRVRERMVTLAPNLTDDEFTILVTPPHLSFSGVEELELAKVAQLVRANQLDIANLPEEVLALLDGIVERFYWIPFGYDGPTTYDRGHYLQVLAEWLADSNRNFQSTIARYEQYESHLRSQQVFIKKKYSITEEMEGLLDRLQLLSRMTDERKSTQFPLHVTFHAILSELANRLRVEISDLKFILPEELHELFGNSQEIQHRAHMRQTGLWVVYKGSDGYWSKLGDEAEALERELLGESENNNLVLGRIGCRGKQTLTKGIARVLMSAQEIGRLRGGDILVTSMTSPEFVPAMRRSAAIITDEGGITCHAAIVSRELNIPCVIGTKNATKLLKDGDMVIVDSEKGSVRILV